MEAKVAIHCEDFAFGGRPLQENKRKNHLLMKNTVYSIFYQKHGFWIFHLSTVCVTFLNYSSNLIARAIRAFYKASLLERLQSTRKIIVFATRPSHSAILNAGLCHPIGVYMRSYDVFSRLLLFWRIERCTPENTWTKWLGVLQLWSPCCNDCNDDLQIVARFRMENYVTKRPT